MHLRVVPTNQQRVKVYTLLSTGLWDDLGTGHASIEYLHQAESMGLVVIGEESGKPLLIHRIGDRPIYARQGGEGCGGIGGYHETPPAQLILYFRVCQQPPPSRPSAGDTIISWTDQEIHTDLALSFEQATGCCRVWDQVSFFFNCCCWDQAQGNERAI